MVGFDLLQPAFTRCVSMVVLESYIVAAIKHKMSYLFCQSLDLLKLTQPHGITLEPSATVQNPKTGFGRALILPDAVLGVALMLVAGYAAAVIHVMA
jgi:hypothetical protein